MALDYNNIDWDLLRPEIVAVAMDEDRRVFGYGHEPRLKEDMWMPETGDYWSTAAIAWTNLPTDWRGSLRIRPHRWQEPDASTPVDAKVWALVDYNWYRRHYAGLGKVYPAGYSAWTGSGVTHVKAILLPNPQNPNEPPPADWRKA